jgi:hypothetical protein
MAGEARRRIDAFITARLGAASQPPARAGANV